MVVSTRRKFIVNCSALAFGATALPVSALVTLPRPRNECLTFAAELNSRFVARNSNGLTQSLQLVEATSQNGTGENFSLLFRGESTQPLDQNTYSFEHARLGRFEMFIVPVGRSGETHCYYEAVFNRG